MRYPVRAQTDRDMVARGLSLVRWRDFPGRIFNLVDDSNPNDPKIVGQFRAVTMTAAPEGYTAVVAVQSTGVPSQVPTIVRSQVIKEHMHHGTGVMGQIAPAGEGLTYSA